MKEKMMVKIIGLVMNKKVRTAVKIVSALMWMTEKGIDIYEGHADKMDEQIYVRKVVEDALKDETGIKRMAKEEARKQVQKEVVDMLRKNAVKEEEVQKFLKSVREAS